MDKQRDILDEALARGVITSAQRKDLAALAGEERTDSEERIKPVGTFNEVFVTFGTALLLNALSGLLMVILREPWVTLIASTGVAWMAAMYFDERKRFRLPIIYACISAAGSVAMALHGMMADPQHPSHGLFQNGQPLSMIILPLCGALAMLAAGAARFRIPFLMLPISIVFTLIMTYAARAATDDISYRLVLGASGLAILAVAVHFDLKDPRRITRMSDFAFWSYVVGSPLFVHSLFLTFIINKNKDLLMHDTQWVWIAALAAAVSFAGLVLNRRALILSTLFYVGFVLFRLLSSVGGAPATMLLISILLIGLYVISLGSRWTQARHHIMSRLPPAWEWLKKLPPY